VVKNDLNQFVVVTLLYHADPAKRSPEWEKEARAGVSAAKFAKEYLIDYTALFGEKIFPEILAKRGGIVLQEPYPEFPDSQVYWGGFDYGAKNPSAFLVYTLDKEGNSYCVWELYEPCRNIKEYVRKMRDCPYWDRIKYIAADPSLWGLTQRKGDGSLTSNYMFFLEAGCDRPMVGGNQDESAWLSMMRAAWAPEQPTFKILSCCQNIIREFEGAVYASMSDKMLMTSNYKEHMVDHNNHALDADKYWRLSRAKLATKTFKSPRMVERWLK
jgi:hypothetical protein